MTTKVSSRLIAASLVALGASAVTWAQTDPGVRAGDINGQPGATTTHPLPLASVTANNPQGVLQFFDDGLDRFQEVDAVGDGLGPRFNLDSCSGCHSQPTIGGSSPAQNPEFTVISRGVASGATNTVPSFLTANGPTREARFPFFFNANGTPNTNAPNGGVETIYVVSGLQGAGSCNLQQPSFAAAQAVGNIIFRIPTPVFGAGLLENIDDSTLLANQRSNANNNFGIGGSFNRNGNDGTIARFGWKAQNKSLDLFSGEAYNVEMGISNETFPQDRPLPGEETNGAGLPANCLNLKHVGYPEDVTNFAGNSTSSDPFAVNASVPSDVIAFGQFMRLLAPPTPSTTTPGGAASITRGRQLFTSIGCSVCHTPSINATQPSHVTPSLGSAPVSAFTDLEIHHMGSGLADNVSQGSAGGDQFRTAPLWGLGQRIFFLHDGRTSNLITAINAHASSGSEATPVAQNFTALSATSRQDLLNFLRSL
jgi:CxxC motif-containing protein (DUF1111 family)